MYPFKAAGIGNFAYPKLIKDLVAFMRMGVCLVKLEGSSFVVGITM